MPSRHSNRNAFRNQHKSTPIYSSSLVADLAQSQPQPQSAARGIPVATHTPPAVLVPEQEQDSFPLLIDIESPLQSPAPSLPDSDSYPESASEPDDRGSTRAFENPNQLVENGAHSLRVRGSPESLPAPSPPAPPFKPLQAEPDDVPADAEVPRPPSLRLWNQDQNQNNDDTSGHTRSPVLAREPTMLETFSRTVRNYVPSSIPIPTAAPSPPLVSRPVSFGSFMTTSTRNNPGVSRAPPNPNTNNNNNARLRGSVQRPNLNAGVSSTRGWERFVGAGQEADDAVFASDDEDTGAFAFGRNVVGGSEVGDEGMGVMSYPRTADQGDLILWARWDSVGERRLLFLAYPSGLQVWDCTNLGSVSEVLNLSGSDWGRVTYAAILPRPALPSFNADSNTDDTLAADRPVIGIVTTINDESTFIVYSLYRHHVVKRLTLPGLVSFLSNEHFIVISTTNPSTLHILSPSTFTTLFTVPSTSLVSAFNKSTIHTNNNNDNNSTVFLQDLDDPSSTSTSTLRPPQRVHPPTPLPHPQPIFALSHRLLAYASPPPRPDAHTSASRHPRTRTPSGPSAPSSAFITQAELGNAALKVGGTVLSGMKSLGGLAYSAARAKAGFDLPNLNSNSNSESGSNSNARGGAGPSVPSMGSLANRFFSRSAPAASTSGHERGRRYSTTSAMSGATGESHDDGGHSLPEQGMGVIPRTNPMPESGHYITIVDLAGLLSNENGKPNSSTGTGTTTMVSEFLASKHQPISDLRFSSDGNSLIVSPKDGQVIQIFQVRPSPIATRGPPSDLHLTSGGATAESRSEDNSRHLSGKRGAAVTASTHRDSVQTFGPKAQDSPWHVYDLKRGRTTAVVEGIDWAHDGRWVAIGTRKRTVHVFAVNPYGGKPDQRSHMESRVRNFSELQPLSAEVHPVVRLRVLKAPPPGHPRVPLAFTFIRSSESSLPASLLPPVTNPPPHSHTYSSSVGSSDATHSEPISPHHMHRPANFQDILVFDPTDGMLSLRRFTMELRPRDQGLSVSASVSVLGGATSISLPGMGGAGRLGVSPPGSNGHGRPSAVGGGRASGLTQMIDPPMDLAAKESVVATWNLQRRHDWGEIRRAIEEPTAQTRKARRGRTAKADWLAQAELSTCSKSPRVLPRSIYLSHQFSFHTLGEDYHALIRRFQLDIGGSKLEVRREVEVSAYSAGIGESFVEGFSAPRDVRRASSSFDEPLASALAAGLDYSLPPAVLPMLPNGMPGSNPKSFRNSIPIRTMAGLSDGMSEGLGRIRSQIHNKVRSPAVVPRSDSSISGSVPLEFDEEDEDFLNRDSQLLGHQDHDEDTNSRATSRGEGDSGASVSTPATSAHPLDDVHDEEPGEDVWQGWESEDKQAIEEAEGFDDISAVGFLDEEQASVAQAVVKRKGRGRRRGL